MYYALYRKYRPQTFSEVIGQDSVTKTLRRQIATGQFAHAYLFTGTRGTGKTSCARILARAINCLDPKDGDPCNACAVCKGLLDGQIFDVHEIDAASNNSVDDIRQMQDEILYTPVSVRYKVYIIDEVHMLSIAAFNALLKTLEEPPAHAIFILATTEAHKVPATILSRCQRFDFLRISQKILADHFRSVLKAEQKDKPDEVADLVAALADGSVRDGLSILDKVLELDDWHEIERALGTIGNETLFALLRQIADRNMAELFRTVDSLYNTSRDLGVLCRELLEKYKELLILKSAGDEGSLGDLSARELELLRGVESQFSVARIIASMNILQDTVQALPRSVDKKADIDICFVRLADPTLHRSPDALLARIERLEAMLANGVPVQTAAAPVAEKETVLPVEVPTEMPKREPKPEQKQVLKPEPKEEPPKTVAESVSEPVRESQAEPILQQENGAYKVLESWHDIVAAARRIDRVTALVLQSCKAIYRGHEILILCDEKEDYDSLKDQRAMECIRQALEMNRKNGYHIHVEVGNISDYVEGFSTYDNLAQNDLFDFQ